MHGIVLTGEPTKSILQHPLQQAIVFEKTTVVTKNQLIARMCNMKASLSSQHYLLKGAATEELKRVSEMQRVSVKRKLSIPIIEPEPAKSLFDFTDLYESVSPETESFPILTWDFNSEDCVAKASKPNLVSPENECARRNKRQRTSNLSGMVRSKSFKVGLSTLDESPLLSGLSNLEDSSCMGLRQCC